jgi:superfamily I DNA/RNA helicase
MSIHAFTGGAGCGKTHQLMARLDEHLLEHPLGDGQKVLALTFMHGSRRRLDERLKSATIPGRAYECATIDSFAWRIAHRWQSLLGALGIRAPVVGDYAGICAAAAALLGQDGVAGWVARSYPVIILDEAQDLNQDRLAILSALAPHVYLFAAADEFQCLDEALRPSPAAAWLAQADRQTELKLPRRTTAPSLLAAAAALRAGEAPLTAGVFAIRSAFNTALAGTFLANELGWYAGRKSVAVITPSGGQFATAVVDWVAQRTTRQKNGPYTIRWERSEDKMQTEYLEQLKLDRDLSANEAKAMLGDAGDRRILSDVADYLDRQRRAKGRHLFTAQELELVIRQSFANRRRFGFDNAPGFRAMTVHGAKNREFDNVIVLWPAAVKGNAEHQRRLLYNATTRAKSRCLILVQSKAALTKPPFVAAT